MRQEVTGERRVLADGFALTESPRWWRDRLFFSDIYRGRVHTVDLEGRVETIAEFDETCSGLGFLPNGDLLIVLRDTGRIMRLTPSGLVLHAQVAHLMDTQINDMVVDRSGRAYVSQLGPPRAQDKEFPLGSRLIIVEPDGAVRAGPDGLLGPNGIALTPDSHTLLTAETRGYRIRTFVVNKGGDLSDEGCFATFTDGYCPDGLCLDSDGGVWVGLIFDLRAPDRKSPGFVRVAKGGEQTHHIALEPGRHAVACTFGGLSREFLFLCTTQGFTGSQLPNAGDARAPGFSTARIEILRASGFTGAGLP